MVIFSIIWLSSISFVIYSIANIVIRTVLLDLNKEDEILNIKEIFDDNPWGNANSSQKSVMEETIFHYIDRYLSLLAVAFSLLIFGLFYVLFLEKFYKYLVSIENAMELTDILLFFALATSGSVITGQFMKQAAITSSRKVIISRAKTIVIAALSFLLFTFVFVFFRELNFEYNLVKGVSMSFCIGVLFYIIYGKHLNLSILPKPKQ